MRIFFAGTPELAVPSLQLLCDRYQVVGVLTAAAKKSGRGRALQSSPVANTASKYNLPLFQQSRPDDSLFESISKLDADLMVVVAYGAIFGKKFIDLFSTGAINLHPSKLPQFRGPSPLCATILAGSKNCAVTVQRLALKMDSGSILSQKEFPLNGAETLAELNKFVANAGSKMLPDVIDSLANGTINEQPQNEEEATYCGIIKKQHGRIDWRGNSEKIARMTRAYNPWPTAYSFYKNRRLAITKADSANIAGYAASLPGQVVAVNDQQGILVKCGVGCLSIKRLRLAGKQELGWRDFYNGNPTINGATLQEN